MSSAANSFLRLNSTVSQPGSPTSCKSEKQSLAATSAGAGGGGGGGRCGGVVRYLNANPRFKKALGHIGLVILLGCYTAAGAAVFQWLERPYELQQSKMLQELVLSEKAKLLSMWGPESSPISNDTVLRQIDMYQAALHQAVSNRVPLEKGTVSEHWTYTQSVFFASTVLTTIGYGNIAPATTAGRIFCIFFALIGIPFTLTVIADLGVLMAAGVSMLYRRIRKRSGWAKSQSAQSFGRKFGRSLSALLIFLLLIVYIAIGGGIFMIWEDWNFLESFYFCFITMTTIGFGDLVPAQTTYMLVSIVYILVGLALTTSIIELIRRQYAQSWKKMQALTNRLQGLTGPLADTLRRITEQAGKLNSDGQLDPALLRELADLKFALSAVNAEMRRPSLNLALETQPDDQYAVSDVDELCSVSNSDSDSWPMEWDECWEERWAAIEEMMINNKAFKDKVMRILSQTSIKV